MGFKPVSPKYMVQFSSTWQQYLQPFKSLANKGLVGNQKGTEEKNQIQFSSDESFQLINLLTLSFSGKKLSERNFDSGWRERKKSDFLLRYLLPPLLPFQPDFFCSENISITEKAKIVIWAPERSVSCYNNSSTYRLVQCRFDSMSISWLMRFEKLIVSSFLTLACLENQNYLTVCF